MGSTFVPSRIHIMLIIFLQIISKRIPKISVILFIYSYIKIRAAISSFGHSEVIEMGEEGEAVGSDGGLEIWISIIVVVGIEDF